MAALANASHAPRMIQPSLWSRVLTTQPGVASAACVSDLFLAMSDAMAAAAPMR
jgi:hypothetical protein